MLDRECSESVQNAGDNAIQGQGSTIVKMGNVNIGNGSCVFIYPGVTEEKARQIAKEMVGEAEAKLLKKFHEMYQNNASKLNDLIIPKLRKADMLGAFEDPGFLQTLYQAYRTALLLQEEKSFDMLSDLLKNRAAHPRIDIKKIALEQAIRILNNVSDASLKGLAAYYCLFCIIPRSGDISAGLDDYAKVFEELGVDDLPVGRKWLDEIDMLGAARISTIGGTMRSLADILAEGLSGYMVRGMKEEDDAYRDAVKLLQKVGLPEEALMAHEFHPGYLRLPFVSESFLESEPLVLAVTDNQPLGYELDDAQRNALKEVYRMTTSPEGVPAEEFKEIRKRFSEALSQRESLRKVMVWWGQMKTAVRVNETGFALGYVYAKQKVTGIPEYM